MKTLYASVIALTAAAAPVTAEMMNNDGDLIRSRDITGGTVYAATDAERENWLGWGSYDSVGENWRDIGEIEDLVLGKDGQMIGVVAEVGGFLDIADKHVMISLEDVSLVPADDEEYALVTNKTEEELEALPGVDEGFWE